MNQKISAGRKGSWWGRCVDGVGRWMVWLDELIKLWMFRTMFFLLHVVVVVAACYLVVYGMARGRCHAVVDEVPARLVGLVLGTAPKVGIRDNLFFTTRMEAAAKLYHAGKVQYLIVSGDNARAGYNEPAEMKKALVKAGVPAERVYCDYAGFRTLDSVVRAKKVFGMEEFMVIAQRFHNERALYIARRNGMPDVVAFDAAMPAVNTGWKVRVREVGARMMAVLDVEVFKTDPRFLGPEVRIGKSSPPVDAGG
ncbi:SanA/YdcF family protein [Phragmitibacter flavus]|nr:ElyC/SanA/YdcF family protein [Phragmitibacter flavus]